MAVSEPNTTEKKSVTFTSEEISAYSTIECVGQYLFAAYLINRHLLPDRHRIHTLVDFGSGAGKSTRAVAPSVLPGGRIIGVDVSEDFLAKAREVTDKIADQHQHSYEFHRIVINNNEERILLEDGIADVVTTTIVLQEIQNERLLRSALREFGRIAKRGAVLSAVCVSDKITCEDYTTFTYAPFPDNAIRVDNYRKCSSTVSAIVWENDRHWSKEIFVDGLVNAGWNNIKAEYPLAPLDLRPFPNEPEIGWRDETRAAPFLFITATKG